MGPVQLAKRPVSISTMYGLAHSRCGTVKRSLEFLVLDRAVKMQLGLRWECRGEKREERRSEGLDEVVRA